MKSIKIGNIRITPFYSNIRFDKRNTVRINAESFYLSKAITKQKLDIIIELLDRIIPVTDNTESKNELLYFKEVTKLELDSVNISALSLKKNISFSPELNDKIIKLKLLLGKNKLDDFQIQFEKIIDPHSKNYNDYIVNKSSLQRVKKYDLQGIITIEQKELILSRKILGLLSILDSLCEEDLLTIL